MASDTPRAESDAERREKLREPLPMWGAKKIRELRRLIDEKDEIRRLREAVVFAHGWIAGLPREPSFEDKRAAQAALESSGAIWPARLRAPSADLQ